jgi:hypothetical protein
MEDIEDIPDQPKQPKGQKALSLEDILLKIGPVTNVSFTPFEYEPKQQAKALLPLSFPQRPHVFDYFSLFFIYDLIQTITTNTNRYTSLQRI